METQRAWVATRKGLFELRQRAGAWAVERICFLGEPVSMLLPPTAGGRMFAALKLGHFGVKLHGSDDAGLTLNELTTPTYPPQPEGEPLAVRRRLRRARHPLDLPAPDARR